MDGPHVNGAFKRKLAANLKSECNGKTVLDIGSCNLHKVNNSFLKAIEDLDFEYDGFACDLCFFFKISSGRRGDFANMFLETEVETENMLKHSKIRWLSIGRSAQRIVDQWLNICKYFLEYLPTKKDGYKRVSKTERFKSIVRQLKNIETKPYLMFAVYLCSLVDDFIKLFQSSHPICYLMYPAIGDLLFKVLTNFVSPQELCKKDKTRKTTYDLGKIDLKKVKFLSLDEMNFGNELKSELNGLAKNGKDMVALKIAFKKSYITFYEALQHSLPWDNDTLRYLQYLHPSLKSDSKALSSIRNLADRICKVLSNTDEVKISRAKHTETIEFEFKVYQVSSNLPEFNPRENLDIYWNSIGKIMDLKRNFIFENLSNFAKTCVFY